MTPPRRPHHPPPRRSRALHLTPCPAVAVTTVTVSIAMPRIAEAHRHRCPGCAFDGGWPETPVTSEPTAAWQRGMRPVSL